MALAISTMEDYLCPKCGQVVFGGEDFCQSCGKRIDWAKVKSVFYKVLPGGHKDLVGKEVRVFEDPVAEKIPMGTVTVKEVVKDDNRFFYVNDFLKISKDGVNFAETRGRTTIQPNLPKRGS